MQNFQFYCPTRVVFGKGSIDRLPDLIKPTNKILMVYGGGSIKKNGVYDKIKSVLQGYNVIEFGGMEANPTYETCMNAVKIVEKEGIDFLLAVGGGSVLDGTKFIAAAACYDDGDPYDILTKGCAVKKALPLGDVITLPATGSEMNGNAVISRKSTHEKLSFTSENVFPKFSIIDPTTTFSLPTRQTINGIVDTFVHTMELYATYDVNTPLQDSWALGLLKTLTVEAPKVMANPNDYDARANVFWCATCGLNYWMSVGVVQDWATHMIGHELTAFYGIDHAQSLAVVLPRLMKRLIEFKREKLAKLGRYVFGITEDDNEKAALQAIDKIEAFFNGIGMKSTLADYDINPDEAATKIRDRFEERGVTLGECDRVTPTVVFEILKAC